VASTDPTLACFRRSVNGPAASNVVSRGHDAEARRARLPMLAYIIPSDPPRTIAGARSALGQAPRRRATMNPATPAPSSASDAGSGSGTAGICDRSAYRVNVFCWPGPSAWIPPTHLSHSLYPPWPTSR